MFASRLIITSLVAFSTAAFAAEGQTATTTVTTATAAPTTAVAPAPAPVMAAAVPPAERIICKRETEIGSLVKGTRRCMTAREWRKSSEDAQKFTRDMQGAGAQTVNH
jgi:hypothetical protein